MKILVDTCVWSLALRHGKDISPTIVDQLRNLISDYRTVMIGPIRQELLSGIRTEQQFNMLKKHLSAFPDEPISSEDYEEAALFFNTCRQNGVQGSNTDFLICSVAIRNNFAIFTTDKDFALFSQFIPIVLFTQEQAGGLGCVIQSDDLRD